MSRWSWVKRYRSASASTDLLLTVMCRMYSVTGSGSGSSSVGSGGDVYFLNFIGDCVHIPKGILNALLLGGIDNDHVAVGVEIGMHRKHGQNLRPITCPCVTVLVVVFHRGFAAFRVR